MKKPSYILDDENGVYIRSDVIFAFLESRIENCDAGYGEDDLETLESIKGAFLRLLMSREISV